MPQTSVEWWTVAGVIVAVIAAIIAWRTLRGQNKAPASRIVQKMMDSEHSSQEATQPGVAQTMEKSKDGKQKA